MYPSTFVVFLLCILESALIAAENLQSWSYQAYHNEPFTIPCLSMDQSSNNWHKLTWTRHGNQDAIVNNDHYELRVANGRANQELVIKKVNDEMEGIYICTISNSSSGEFLFSLIKGVNLGPRLYNKDIDKYEENIYVGLVAGGSVFVLIVGVCLIDRFRYLSEESLEKRRTRKENQLTLKSNGKNGGNSNAGYQDNGVNGTNDTWNYRL